MIKDNQTGETYSSISGLARMCDRNDSTIRDYTTSRFLDSEMAEILTTTGKKTPRFFSESQMLEVIAKYNPTL
jgi:hypothetical protein